MVVQWRVDFKNATLSPWLQKNRVVLTFKRVRSHDDVPFTKLPCGTDGNRFWQTGIDVDMPHGAVHSVSDFLKISVTKMDIAHPKPIRIGFAMYRSRLFTATRIADENTFVKSSHIGTRKPIDADVFLYGIQHQPDARLLISLETCEVDKAHECWHAFVWTNTNSLTGRLGFDSPELIATGIHASDDNGISFCAIIMNVRSPGLNRAIRRVGNLQGLG